MLQFTAWSIPPALAVVLAVFCLVRLRATADLPGLTPLRGLILCAAVWSFGQLAASLVTTIDLKYWTLNLQYVGAASVGAAWFTFAITYARQQRRLPLLFLVAIWSIPAATVVLAVTSDWHGLIWDEIGLVGVGGYIGVVASSGPVQIASMYYTYALVFSGLTVIGFVLTSNPRYRAPLAALTVATMATFALHFVHVSPWNPLPWFDATPLGLSLAALLLIYGLVNPGFLDLVPAIRYRVFERLDDPVVIVNPSGRIIDVNASASAQLLARAGNPLNQNLRVLLPIPGISDLLSGRLTDTDLTIGPLAYHVAVTALDGKTNPTRLAFVFRDVTERRNSELQLRTMKRDLERLAHTDSLTGLYNRRFFMQRLDEEAERFNRHARALSVLVFDLDLFKRVNDEHGHEIGDKALQVVAGVMNDIRRVSDVAARIGGEEFALLLPETDRDGATRLAQRLRRAIADQFIADAEGQPFTITVSIGVATLTQSPGEPTMLLREADKALYRAKSAGRNMVCLAA
jgi:diguanylate cyclase (GGDEF)-like protein